MKEENKREENKREEDKRKEEKEKFEESIQRDPSDFRAKVNLANFLVQETKELQKTKKESDDSEYKVQIRELQQQLNEEAVGLYDEAMELDPDWTREHAFTSCIFQPPPEQRLSFHDISGESIEGESIEGESSSEEELEFDQEAHFFRLAKEQYEDILSKEPDNALIQQRYRDLLERHGEEVEEIVPQKRRKKKR